MMGVADVNCGRDDRDAPVPESVFTPNISRDDGATYVNKGSISQGTMGSELRQDQGKLLWQVHRPSPELESE